ncbi:MAG: response regulator [Gammaproteobacteria bacterium]|jgi:two-component system invasion response regulator UvrY|nr:response regulator [Gammaproteobacteria bacterium]MBP6051313.1 response regulator [Pseudomonadales bacterium]MBK6581659.1 response regulator [Gammaproteobacteria bacterium]MBK7522420.1 response regulator [Gammaproteobacteria bacterium]MBK7728594.1 response regulator [Gammaproteobacteria bacterium]
MGTAASEHAISVLMVDDHDIVRRGIASTLGEIPDIRILGEAASGEEAIRLARSLCPDVVLMDLRMPGIGGLEAARRIHIALPATRIVAVTAWDAEPPQRLHKSGISACVGKNVARAELEAVIRRVCEGRRSAACAVATAQVDAGTANPFDLLTGREMQVCALMLTGEKAVQIARELFITTKTVHTFRYRIFEKLGVNGEVGLTRLAACHGVIGAQPA